MNLQDFLTTWHGPPDLPPTPPPPNLPRPLSDWFELTSRWSKPLETQNSLTKDLTPDNGKQIVWIENQSVWLWAIDPDTEDPEVYIRENHPGHPWTPIGSHLTDFLEHVTIFETLMSAPSARWTKTTTPAQLAHMLAPLTPVDMPPWRWPSPGFRLYTGECLIAFATDGGEAWVSATDSSRLSYLAELGIEWDSEWD